jgi:hypothetical protein
MKSDVQKGLVKLSKEVVDEYSEQKKPFEQTLMLRKQMGKIQTA